MWVAELGSTNDRARELGESGAAEWTWVAARRQTGGRGRQGRTWEGGEGNLFLSLLLRPAPGAALTWIPLLAAVSLCEALAACAPPGAELPRIKWPNDLWLGGAKLAGILAEGTGSRAGAFVVLGLGCNVARAPAGLDQATASLEGAWGPGRAPSREELADLFRERFRADYEARIAAPGGADGAWLRERYLKHALLETGTGIEWDGGRERGEVAGLGEHGELIVLDAATGTERRLYAEDVRAVRLKPRRS